MLKETGNRPFLPEQPEAFSINRGVFQRYSIRSSFVMMGNNYATPFLTKVAYYVGRRYCMAEATS
jgi:hypothetical protein